MIRFNVITIFPELIDAYFSQGVIARAKGEGTIIRINAHNLRDWTEDAHKTVDDSPFGGGPGMILKFEPIYKAVSNLRKFKVQSSKFKVVLTSARGKKFTQKKAQEYSKLDQLIIICGRYEGVDERVAGYIADESISIGDFVLSGGELGAMVIIEAVARLIPGVLGNEASPSQALFPQYTRPEVFKSEDGKEWKVPKILLSGNHRVITEWRKKHSTSLNRN
ncbi:MAG: tRNA (guanosine(37)-N1)-methyltransferase TrmD [Candidatus Portnoybacteria bacterium]|nr:tRNA (guanosine(37)-N1)-methyltransferase TrmD [Candidatus Portnoybacteria bacterium]